MDWNAPEIVQGIVEAFTVPRATAEEVLAKPLLRYAAAKGYDRVEFAPGFKSGGLSPRVRALAEKVERGRRQEAAARRERLPEHGGLRLLRDQLGEDGYELREAYLRGDERPRRR